MLQMRQRANGLERCARMDKLDILEKLVGFDTTSHKSNKEIVDWIFRYLAEHDVQAKLEADETNLKFNLTATIGPAADDGVVLSGHTDVVPITDQPWTMGPFALTRSGSRLYGRGTTDMKGFLACVLAIVPTATAMDLKRPIHLAFTYDEEVGCFGVQELLKSFGPAGAVIVGEPTSMQIGTYHKGHLKGLFKIRGIAAHSSKPELGVNAIEYASRICQEIVAVGQSLKKQPVTMADDTRLFSTVNLGTISGGAAHNIVAEYCEIVWSLRTTPGQEAMDILSDVLERVNALEKQMKHADDRCSIHHEIHTIVPPFTPGTDQTAQALCVQTLGSKELIGLNFASEAGFFSKAGYSTIVCGPGSIEQAHKPDEFVEVSQLDQCERFLRDILKGLSNGGIENASHHRMGAA